MQSKKALQSICAFMFVLPGTILIDFDDNFYNNIQKLNHITQSSSFESNLNATKSAYKNEDLIISLSKLRSKSKSLRIGHIKIVHKKDQIAVMNEIAIENVFLSFFNFDNQNKVNIDEYSKQYRLKNIKAKIEFTNNEETVLNTIIEFNNHNVPTKTFNLFANCVMILSWPFRPVDLEEMF